MIFHSKNFQFSQMKFASLKIEASENLKFSWRQNSTNFDRFSIFIRSLIIVGFILKSTYLLHQ